jgi:serine/threonine protein kinase
MSRETQIGTVVGNYRLESVIGRGGMSVIYLAEQLRLGRKVALKLLAPELGRDERFRERFLRESQLASTIEHPNIIQIHDAGEDDGQLYIAMRYVGGPSLKQLIAREGTHGIGVGRAIYILEQIASALDAAHAKGLVHRDIKPANILLEDMSDHAFLTDFGVAKHTTSSGLTATGLFLGTIEYCSPEQIEGRPVDARTDIYGLGCVAVESLTGLPPFEHETEVALMHAHLSAPPPRVTLRRPELRVGLNAVIAQALAKEPDARYQTAGEFAAALREAALRSSAPTETASVAPSSPPPAVVETVVSPTGAQSERGAGSFAPETAASAPSLSTQPRRWGFRRPHGRSAALVAMLVALLVGAAGAVAGVLLTRGGSKSAGASMHTSAAMSTAAGGHMGTTGSGSHMSMTVASGGTPAQRLTAFVAGQKAWTCSDAQPLHGAMKAETCSTHVPQHLTMSIFDTKAMLNDAYAAALKDQGGPRRGSGGCSATSWRGEGRWFHGEGEPGGRVFCYLDAKNGSSHIVWTSNLGIPTLYDAVYTSLDHRNLFYWWANVRHELI